MRTLSTGILDRNQEILRLIYVSQCNASLVIRHHTVTPGEPDELFKRLFQLCDYHMDVFPLSSGRSGSVSGQV